MICFLGLAVLVFINVGNICAYSDNENKCTKLSDKKMMTKLECSYPEYGYVMATHYSDQMTGSPPIFAVLGIYTRT